MAIKWYVEYDKIDDGTASIVVTATSADIRKNIVLRYE